MKAINLKALYGSKAFYRAIKAAFKSGHNVTNFNAACNYAEWILYNPLKD